MAAASSLQPLPVPLASPAGNLSKWPTEDEQCSSRGCYPRLFIIGAQKAATASLFRALKTQCSSCGSVFPGSWADLGQGGNQAAVKEGGNQAAVKEANVFNMAGALWQNLLKDPKRYQELYRTENCPTRHFVDGSPQYSRSPISAARIPELLPSHWRPQLRFLMSIREPIARDLSWFNHRLSAKARGVPQPEYTFCSVTNSSASFPTYAAEVHCREQELNECLVRARRRLAKAEAPAPRERGGQNDEDGAANATSDAGRLAEFEWCADESVWSKSEHVDLRNRPVETPVLTWGMYLPQIRTFVRRAGVARGQLLVLSFERLVTNPHDALPRVTQFMGLPEMQDPTLLHAHPTEGEHKVQTIRCETRAKLERVYADWNDMLFRGLHGDRQSGLAPPQEPPFDGFAFEVPCDHTEVTSQAPSPHGSVQRME